jgi:hypothetical protein
MKALSMDADLNRLTREVNAGKHQLRDDTGSYTRFTPVTKLRGGVGKALLTYEYLEKRKPKPKATHTHEQIKAFKNRKKTK